MKHHVRRRFDLDTSKFIVESHPEDQPFGSMRMSLREFVQSANFAIRVLEQLSREQDAKPLERMTS